MLSRFIHDDDDQVILTEGLTVYIDSGRSVSPKRLFFFRESGLGGAYSRCKRRLDYALAVAREQETVAPTSFPSFPKNGKEEAAIGRRGRADEGPTRYLYCLQALLGVPGRERESFINRIRWPGQGESTCALCVRLLSFLFLSRVLLTPVPHAIIVVVGASAC